MSVVSIDRHPDFSIADLAMFRDIIARLIEPFHWAGWPGWELRPAEGREGAAIECVNPNDWEWLRFSRTTSGQYVARDEEGVATEAGTFAELLERVGFVDA